MWKRTPPCRRISCLAHLTGGFTLIAAGFGIIFGLGVGLIVAGVLWAVVATVAYS
jgi:hypothetical protein